MARIRRQDSTTGRRGRIFPLLLMAMALLAAACADGGDGDVETAASTTSTTVQSSTTTTTSPATTTSTTAAAPTAEAEPGPATYTIAPGDSLAAIAADHGVALDALIAANGITDPNHIEVGQELAIPEPGQTFDAPPPPADAAPEQAAPPPPQADPTPAAPQPPTPPPPPPAPVVSGADLFFNHCSGCHGASGQGASGPALGGGAVAAKYPNPADQIAVVTNGRAAMPAYGGIITPEEIDAVVHFTRSL